jgi:hypothetical protein
MLNETVRAIETVTINATMMDDVEELKRVLQLLQRVSDRVEDKIIDLEPEPQD